jgi:menaquinone reductase, molybdopterin-binding-like subunit
MAVHRNDMQRRDFLKISAAGGAAAALEGCGNPDHQLIRFIPEEDLIPGLATWKPSICTLCPAGCGTLVRVMQGEAEVVRNGQLGILKMGLAKKIEGNPAHPINQGKLCPRGHAALQVTYHPDRIKTPLQRTGPRGSGQFKEITWDEAIKQLVAQLSPRQLQNPVNGSFVFVTPPLRGQRKTIVDAFSYALAGGHIEFAFLDSDVTFHANSESFGNGARPTVDLGQSNYVISFGADFLGTWNSPVAQSIGYGHMRKGRAGQRGKFVHFESRISQTAASADEWIPSRPGTDGVLALGLAHVILRDKLRPASAAGQAGQLFDGWTAGLPDYAPEKVENQSGVPAATIIRIAHEAAANSPCVAMIGDAPAAHTNGLFNARAVNALNALLGSVGKPGGISFSPAVALRGTELLRSKAELSRPEGPGSAPIYEIANAVTRPPRVLLLHDADLVFGTPAAQRFREMIEKAGFIASFSSFIDDTSAFADLILPDHSPLESWLDDAPESGSMHTVVSLAPPAMARLHNTRSMPDVLLEVAQQIGGNVAKALPWKSYDEALKAAFTNLYNEIGKQSAKDADEFWTKAQAQGGWWSTMENSAPAVKTILYPKLKPNPEFDGDAAPYPFYFLPFASQMLYDGSLAHLPWMQEAPDPLSSVMWGTWVEINTRTAEKLGVKMGDMVEVASQHGNLRAPALVTPAIAPDVIAMPIGQGHENFTRYASGRGANPISILAPMTVAGTNSLAWAATRVKITRIGEGKIAMFGASMSEESVETKHR